MISNGADVALAIMGDLVACLRTALEERSSAPCSLSIIPGIQAYPDKGCGAGGCGQAWVRLDRIYGSTAFPLADAKATCATGLAAVIELGILRCVPTLDAAGNGPTDLDNTQATIEVLSDASALIEAVNCCPAVTERQHFLGAWEPRDAADMGGGVIQVTVQARRIP